MAEVMAEDTMFHWLAEVAREAREEVGIKHVRIDPRVLWQRALERWMAEESPSAERAGSCGRKTQRAAAPRDDGSRISEDSYARRG